MFDLDCDCYTKVASSMDFAVRDDSDNRFDHLVHLVVMISCSQIKFKTILMYFFIPS